MVTAGIRRRWPTTALAAALAVAGCAAVAHGHRAHPSPSARVTPQATPFTSPASGPGAGTLSCSLPIYGASVTAQSAPGTALGGFLELPSGAVDPVPDTGVIAVAGAFSEWETQATPALYGDVPEESYDQPLAQWVPARPSELSPSGTQYAYVTVGDVADPSTTSVQVHLVTIATASDQVIYSQGETEVLGWNGEQLLLVDHIPTSDVAEGLLSLDPATATAVTLQPEVSGVDWYLAAAGAVWGGRTNPADSSPPAVFVPWDEALRYDLTTGQISTWSYHPGDQVTVVGATSSGDPLETIQGTGQTTLAVATSPTSAVTLLTGPGLASARGLAVYSTYTDAHGTWVATDQGLYLLTPTLRFIQEQVGNFAGATLVGPCG